MGKFENIAILTDLDGTFFADGAKVVERNLEAIEYFKSEGGLFSIATGRMHFNLEECIPGVEELVNAPAVLCNGTYLYDFKSGVSTCETLLDADAAYKTVQLAIEHKFEGFIRGSSKRAYVVDTEDKRGGNHLLKFGLTNFIEVHYAKWDTSDFYKLVFDGEVDELARIEELIKIEFPGVYEYNRSRPTLLELQRCGITKASLFEIFKEYYKKQGRDIVIYACGDNNNDEAMLKKADVAVCPSNATDEVKAICHKCLCSNNEGVIADLIYSL